MDPKPGATTYDKLINRFHEANELYDLTLNQLNLSVFVTSSNDNYTYLQAMQKLIKMILLALWWLRCRRTKSVTTGQCF